MASKAQNFEDKLRVLREDYVKNLSSKVDEIENLWLDLAKDQWAQDNIATLHRFTHSLIGSGSTFGFTDVSNAARTLDTQLKSLLDLTDVPDAVVQSEVEQKLADLKSVCEITRAEHQPQKPSAKTGSTTPASNDASHVDQVIYIDAGSKDAKMFAEEIEQYGYQVKRVALKELQTQEQAQNLLQNGNPQAIIFDTDADGLETDSGLKYFTQDSDKAIPVVFITPKNSLQTRLQAVRHGGEAYFSKPVDIATVIDSLKPLSRQQDRKPYRVLVIDDTKELAAAYSVYLQQAGMSTKVITDPLLTLDAIIEFNPELVLMDMYMPNCSGRELAAVIRQHGAYTSLPIVFLSGEADINKQLAAMSLGGDDFLTKPIDPKHLVAAVQIRAERYRQLRVLMERDSLTGLLNHTKSEEYLEVEIARANRQNMPLTFAMIDIDHFKSVNDTYGHAVGDKVIKSLTRLLQQSLRKTDVIGRYGGEEFVVILVNTDNSAGYMVMDKIRHKFENIRHRHNGKTFVSTFSCGIASYPTVTNSGELQKVADEALYRAKNNGRNQIVSAES